MDPNVLMVAEKPSIAFSIASVLSSGCMSTRRASTDVHEFDGLFQGFNVHYKVTSVIGHVFSVDFPPAYQNWETINPLDLFQAPILKTEANPKARIARHLSQEARGCKYLVLWLDCDREGENICFEVIECTGIHPMDGGRRVYRARFSSVTESDIRKAMQNLVEPNKNEALAVDARQEIDLKVGVAFTRFQTRYFQGKYGNLDSSVISYGPCQTPTLGFCVQRYLQITTFRPEKFWSLHPYISKSGYELRLEWDRSRVFDLDVTKIFEKLVVDEGKVKVIGISTKEERKARPFGLNTVNLLKVASSALGLGPHQAMQIAERLYTQGFISYPRTESTAYPATFDFRSTLAAQLDNPTWGSYVQALLADGFSRPRTGNDAGDHPPVTPMRLATEDMLGSDAWRLYQYVTQHFIGTGSRPLLLGIPIPTVRDLDSNLKNQENNQMVLCIAHSCGNLGVKATVPPWECNPAVPPRDLRRSWV
ncbi:hypothetical protein AMTR_s00005p00164560 [Amborella trichopoda]|uniref:DNA topoisomerase n=1 Tax=Amborella trichopoda TaxID=13333 RepID=W1PGM2_AMBTC|nr:hypothetical protein AMTR_s00005p00164560 [Amborella trichopoda]